MFGKAGLGGLMKQAQQMQENAKEAQTKLAETEVKDEAGNGPVRVMMTYSHVVHKLEINPDLIQGAVNDKEMLEDLILAAISVASEKTGETANRTVGALTQDLPAGMGDLFRWFKINKRPSEARLGFQTASFIMRIQDFLWGRTIALY